LNLYAESSAVLAWLLGEPAGRSVHRELRRAGYVLTSDLTLIECDRALTRTFASGGMRESAIATRREILAASAARWGLLRIDVEVVERARRPFPGEPIRSLDAIHLASALAARAAVPDLSVLSLDRRVRAGARGLGLSVVPARAE